VLITSESDSPFLYERGANRKIHIRYNTPDWLTKFIYSLRFLLPSDSHIVAYLYAFACIRCVLVNVLFWQGNLIALFIFHIALY
jgi:hypothetical protein